MRSRHLLMLAAMLLAGCTSHTASDGGVASSSSGTTSGGSSTGGSSSAGSNSGTSSGGASNGTTGISGTTTSVPPSPYFDGGYVFCSGSPADGGPARWMCQPGTYFCDLGDFGVCFQCRDDSDCFDTSLPTYDLHRPRCDVDSGVAGYQGFCQQCLADNDCNVAGASHCDLDPNFPSGSLQPSIETLGFEACGSLKTDCRELDGPLCSQFDEVCNQGTGRCQAPGVCDSDQDCVGQFGIPYLLAPFCVSGSCRSCQGDACLYGQRCFGDADCDNPDSLPTGLLCDGNASTCGCTDSSQCGGFWPICMGFDAGGISYGGAPLGFCGCDDSAQCGDAGLICIPPRFDEPDGPYDVGAISGAQDNFGPPGRQGSFCGEMCSAPGFPACATLPLFTSGGPVSYDACDPTVGLCEYCTDSASCEGSLGSGGPICDTIFSGSPVGTCTCVLDSDCAYGYACLTPPARFGRTAEPRCTPVLARCSPADCASNFCNWMTGKCASPTDPTLPRCLDDYDCPDAGRCEGGKCLGCVDDGDCTARGPVANSMCCHDDPACTAHGFLDGTCAPLCSSDTDCVGSTRGPKCEVDGGQFAGGTFFSCGCATSADCAQNPFGLLCVTDPDSFAFGSCACQSNAQCPAGDSCQFGSQPNDGGNLYGTCSPACGPYVTAPCPDGFSCGPEAVCRPRCDEGRACSDPDLVCDLADQAGQNGAWGFDDGADAGDAIWCYACLDSRDCDGRLGCRQGACAECGDARDCFAGTACASDGLCHETCDEGRCDGGQVCDARDRAGTGKVCFDCVSSEDCPNGEGCDSHSHTCGTCEGPTVFGGPYDCPPNAICSSYWIGGTGVCLQNCDREACPASAPNCGVFPSLTPDHAYCFGCRQDEDCADGGWCDQAVHHTFTCQDTPR